jgi:BirA family biotin operon repressor/biotin-[acetyl-CoA-carboxylase] ligase
VLVVDGDVELAGMRSVESLIVNAVVRSADYCKTTESTNTKALLDVRNGNIEETLLPKCYLADGQTAGRGRHGRSWQSDGGTLTFSLVMKRCVSDLRQTQLLPLAVGLGVARFIDFEYAPLQSKLKWPNDVNLGGGKVAGVLLETSGDSPGLTVVGVGVNVSSEPGLEINSQGISSRSLSQVVGRQINRYDVFASLVESIVNTVSESQIAAESIVDDFRRRCLLTGQQISFQHQNQKCFGTCQGISEEGTLLVNTAQGVQSISSGEARLVRISEN